MLVQMCRALLAVFILVPTGLMAAECRHSGTEFFCVEYVRNYDGDTITFNIPNVHPLIGQNINIRVKDIDAPELRTSDPCERSLAIIARDYVTDVLLRANRIELMNVERDKYFRILANVRVNGRYLERTLLNLGLAVPYDGGTKAVVDWCAMLSAYVGS